MVYDEGFEVRVNNGTEVYFAFSKYSKNDNSNKNITSQWVSQCYSTLIGWYRNGENWGCFYGKKDDVSSDEVTNGEATDKQIITEDSATNLSSLFGFLQQKESSSKNSPVSLIDHSRFMETQSLDTMVLDASFKDHDKLVERINSANLSWKAKSYDEFKKYTMGDLNKIVGGLRLEDGRHRDMNIHKKKKGNEVVSKNNNNPLCLNLSGARNNVEKKDLEEMNFDCWKKYMPDSRSQGGCGSCYAMATIGMLEARFKIKYPNELKNDFEISVDHILKCSFYNQGCDGGYSFLVSKFYKEFEIFPKQCFSEKSTECKKECLSKDNNEKHNFLSPIASKIDYNNIKLSVEDYYYVGGSYGKTTEEGLMKELWLNGPIVVSLSPGPLFMSYNSGILGSTKENDVNQYLKLKNKQWQKVDHSIILVGWGTEKGVKYWILQNSWGEGWGEQGYVRMIRGVNYMSIESIGEAAIPLYENKSNRKNKTKAKK
jgi:cathepsin C